MPERGLWHPAKGYRQQMTSDRPVPAGWSVVPLRPSPLHEWIGGAWVETAPAEVTAVPRTIGVAQLLIGLSHPNVGWITEAEAEAWAAGNALPAAALALIEELPAPDRLPARLRMLRMKEVDRDHPLVASLGAAQGRDDDEIDDFFRFCATL